MRLREFFLVEDDDDKSNGIPIPAGDDEDTPDAGSGDLSNGVPSPIGAQGRKMRSAGQASAKTQMVPTSQPWAGKSMDHTQELPTDYDAPRFNSTNAGDNPAAVRSGQRQGSTTGITPIGGTASTRQVPVAGGPPPTKAAPAAATSAIHPWGGSLDWDEQLPSLPQEGRLGEMFALTEMPRPMENPMKAALAWASQQKGEFSIRQMFNVYRENGGQPNQPNTPEGNMRAYQSFSTNLKKRTVTDETERPTLDKPLVLARVGSVGAGRAAMLRWGIRQKFDGPTAPAAKPAVPTQTAKPAGAPAPKQLSPLKKPEQEPEPEEDDSDFWPSDEAPAQSQASEPESGADWDLDDMGLGPAGSSSIASAPEPKAKAASQPSQPPAAQKAPEDEDLPDLADMVGGDVDFDDDEGSPEPEPAQKGPFWMPEPDPEGSGAEYAMAVLQQGGLGPDNKILQDVAKAKDGAEALKILRGSGPNLFRQKKQVARYILSRLDKDAGDLIG